MNRRAFFGSLAGLAGASIDPERLLWRPGKLISIAPAAKPSIDHDAICRILEADMEAAYQEMLRKFDPRYYSVDPPLYIEDIKILNVGDQCTHELIRAQVDKDYLKFAAAIVTGYTSEHLK